MNDPITRNVVAKDECEKLLQNVGVNEDTILRSYRELIAGSTRNFCYFAE